MRGFFGIGIYQPKNEINIGTLWRSATLFGADYIFTIGRRYRQQASDTQKATRHMPMFHWDSLDDLVKHLPYASRLVGVELIPEAKPINSYKHPVQAVYLLGAEDNGLSSAAIDCCHDLVVLPGSRSMNVAVAGSIVMYDRFAKANQ